MSLPLHPCPPIDDTIYILADLFVYDHPAHLQKRSSIPRLPTSQSQFVTSYGVCYTHPFDTDGSIVNSFIQTIPRLSHIYICLVFYMWLWSFPFIPCLPFIPSLPSFPSLLSLPFPFILSFPSLSAHFSHRIYPFPSHPSLPIIPSLPSLPFHPMHHFHPIPSLSSLSLPFPPLLSYASLSSHPQPPFRPSLPFLPTSLLPTHSLALLLTDR